MFSGTNSFYLINVLEVEICLFPRLSVFEMVDDASVLVAVIDRILSLLPVAVQDSTEVVPPVDFRCNRSGYVYGVDINDAKRLCSSAVSTDVFPIEILEVPPVASVIEVYYSEACLSGGYRTLATEDRYSMFEEVDW